MIEVTEQNIAELIDIGVQQHDTTGRIDAFFLAHIGGEWAQLQDFSQLVQDYLHGWVCMTSHSHLMVLSTSGDQCNDTTEDALLTAVQNGYRVVFFDNTQERFQFLADQCGGPNTGG